MDQNSLEKGPNLGEKSVFSDTGSAIFENLQKNQDKSVENHNVLSETIQNAPKQPKTTKIQ